MVSTGVSWNGKTNISFIDTKATKPLTPCVTRNYWMRDFHPTDAECTQMRLMFFNKMEPHTSRATQSYLEGSTPSFIKKDEWPPNLQIAIPWITVYGVHFQRKFTAEGRLFFRRGTKGCNQTEMARNTSG